MDFLRWPWHFPSLSKTDHNEQTLKRVERLLAENINFMSQITTLTTAIAANLTAIGTDLTNIAANGVSSAADVAAVQSIATQATALQAQADALAAAPAPTPAPAPAS
jgi:hypothetical protein